MLCLFITFTVFICIYIYMCVLTPMLWYKCGDQRTTWSHQFYTSNNWVCGIKLWSSVLTATAFLLWVNLLTTPKTLHHLFIYLFICNVFIYAIFFETSSYRLNQKFQILVELITHQVPELHQSWSSPRTGIKDVHMAFYVESGVLNSLVMLVHQGF